MVSFYRDLINSEDCEVKFVFSNYPRTILEYTDEVIACDIHSRFKTKAELKDAKVIIGLDDILVESQNPSIIVSGEVYPGTRISIMDVSMVVKSTMKYCKFVRLQGDVKMVSI